MHQEKDIPDFLARLDLYDDHKRRKSDREMLGKEYTALLRLKCDTQRPIENDFLK